MSMKIRDGLKYFTISGDSRLGGVTIYGWGTYPRNSVLAGQARKVFLENVESEELARQYIEANYGKAAAKAVNWSSKWTEPQVNLSQLPGDDDPDPLGDNRAEHDSVANDWKDW